MGTKKRPIAVADCETDPFKKGRTDIKPFVWGFYDGVIYKKFDTTIAFIGYVRDLDIVVYAHNGGKFDWFFVLPYLDEFCELMIINGRLAKFKIGNCEFRDSYNLLPVPLAAYKKDEISYDIFEEGEREKPANKKLIEDYLRTDCIYLYELVSHFVNQYGSGLTLAGSAMKFWQKHFDQVAPRTSKYFYETFREYYYGGHVECFTAGVFRKDFKVIDINSAYPYAMKFKHPYGRTYEVSSELPKTEAFIQRSFIKLECISKGALPFRSKKGLIFPSDNEKRIYSVTGWEYLAGIETGTLSEIKIIEVTQFSDSIDFGDYIDHFYALKSDSERDSPDYIIAKLFLNSLYGKFGSNPDEYMEYTIAKPEHIIASECDGYEFGAMLGDWALLQKPLDDEKQHYFNVAVAASITGFVRAYLFKALTRCNGLIYCDTDSIAACDIGGLTTSDTLLGGWKVEAECDWGAVAGKKLYVFHTKEGKVKKASKGARLTWKEIVKVAKGVPQLYEPIAPSFSLKRGITITNRRITKNV